MSTRTFVNALIGLAREYRMKERKIERDCNALTKKQQHGQQQCARMPNCYRSNNHAGRCWVFTAPSFGHEITQMMKEDGYFTPASAEVFGDAVESLLQSSTPDRKKK